MKFRCKELTVAIDLGLIDSHTRPVKILVTAKATVKRSALDCELQSINYLSVNLNKSNSTISLYTLSVRILPPK